MQHFFLSALLTIFSFIPSAFAITPTPSNTSLSPIINLEGHNYDSGVSLHSSFQTNAILKNTDTPIIGGTITLSFDPQYLVFVSVTSNTFTIHIPESSTPGMYQIQFDQPKNDTGYTDGSTIATLTFYTLQTGEARFTVDTGTTVLWNDNTIHTISQNDSFMRILSPSLWLTPTPYDAPIPCIKTGCSGQLCADHPITSTCEWRESYACYQSAVCERQPNGACEWTMTPQLHECLNIPSQSPPITPNPLMCSGATCIFSDDASTTGHDTINCSMNSISSSTTQSVSYEGQCSRLTLSGNIQSIQLQPQLDHSYRFKEIPALPGTYRCTFRHCVTQTDGTISCSPWGDTPVTTTPTPVCQPRPTCLDEVPACLIPEPAQGWCPPTSLTTTPVFICPETEWLNCMPMIGTEGQHRETYTCEQPYLTWAKNNCPGFQGAAY